MRRTALSILAIIGCLGVLATPASAGGPTAVQWKFEITPSGSFVTFPAGTFCDFTYEGWASGWGKVVVVGDYEKVIVHQSYTDWQRNVEGEYTLTEKVAFQDVYLPGVSREVIVGVQFHLRDANGNLITLQAGQIRFDLTTGAWTYTGSMTAAPWDNPSMAAVVCPALGGRSVLGA